MKANPFLDLLPFKTKQEKKSEERIKYFFFVSTRIQLEKKLSELTFFMPDSKT